MRQHDSNYFEEGLNVPWVMVGPGVPRGTIAGDYSLLDVMPTVLDLLGVKGVVGDDLAGRSLLSTASSGGPRPFVCWFDFKCRGYVQAGVKIVHEPMFGESFAFELARDPHERHARPLTAAERRTLAEVELSLAKQDEPGMTDPWPRVDTYPNWSCNEGERCRHVRLN